MPKERGSVREVMGWGTQEASARIRARHDRHNNEIMNDLFRPVASELSASAGRLLAGGFPWWRDPQERAHPKFDQFGLEGRGVAGRRWF